MKAYSRDIRVRIVRAHQNSEGSQRDIAARFDVSLSFVRDLLRQYRETGSIAPRPHGGGPRPLINEQGVFVIADLLRESPGATLDELREVFERRFNFAPSRATLSRVVKKLRSNGMSMAARAGARGARD